MASNSAVGVFTPHRFCPQIKDNAFLRIRAKLNLMLCLVLKLHILSRQTAIKTISKPFVACFSTLAPRQGFTEDQSPRQPAPPTRINYFFSILCATLWPQIVWNAIREPKLSSNGEPGLPTSVAIATPPLVVLLLYLQNAPLSHKPPLSARWWGVVQGGGGWGVTAACSEVSFLHLVIFAGRQIFTA